MQTEAPPRQKSETTNGRVALIQQAFRLEYFTLAWMMIESVVAMDRVLRPAVLRCWPSESTA
ncbi:hypothetical protein [Bradyrhizobium genosp. P]|uniref:hypothetical protein n=1 Tax=Bradyrhizobium genosp. P TaxID=83641 RepID=UPI003CEEC7E6